MLHVQHSVDLRQVPAQASGEFRFTDPLVSHSLVENHLDRGKSRQRRAMFSKRGGGDVPAIVNSGRYRLFKCVDGASQRFVPVIAARRQLLEVSRRDHYGPIVVFERNWIGKHQFNPTRPQRDDRR